MLLISGLATLATNPGFGAVSQGETPPPPRQLVAAAHPAPAAQPAENFAGNQVLHILVGHSVVIRTDARLRRVLVGNPAVVATVTTAPNELVVTANTSGSSSVVLWQEDNRSRILEVFSDLDVSMLREAFARNFPREPIQVEAEENRIILSGAVSAIPIAEQAVKMAAPFSKELVNSIRIAPPGRQRQILLKVKWRPGGPGKTDGLWHQPF